MVSGLIVIYGGLLWVVTAVAVWYNASTTDRDERFWAVVALLTGVFGAVIYLLVDSAGDPDPDPDPMDPPASGANAEVTGATVSTVYRRRRREERALEDALESHLRSADGADAESIRATLYPEHPVGFESADRWWTEFVEPTLETREDVETRGDAYRLES